MGKGVGTMPDFAIHEIKEMTDRELLIEVVKLMGWTCRYAEFVYGDSESAETWV